MVDRLVSICGGPGPFVYACYQFKNLHLNMMLSKNAHLPILNMSALSKTNKQKKPTQFEC